MSSGARPGIPDADSWPEAEFVDPATARGRLAVGRRAAQRRPGVHRRAPRVRRAALGAVGRRGLRHVALPATPARGVRLSTSHVNNVPIAEFVMREVMDRLPARRPVARRRGRAPLGAPRVARGLRLDVAGHRARRDRHRRGRRARRFGCTVIGVRRAPGRHRAGRRDDRPGSGDDRAAPRRRRGLDPPRHGRNPKSGERRLPRRNAPGCGPRERGPRLDRRRGRADPGPRRGPPRLRGARRGGRGAAPGRRARCGRTPRWWSRRTRRRVATAGSPAAPTSSPRTSAATAPASRCSTRSPQE